MSAPNLIGMHVSELEGLATELGAPRYRGRQLATWLYRNGVFDLDAMTDLPKDFRVALAQRAVVSLPELERATPSQDGSRKLVFALPDGARISSVVMPDDGRVTLCLSTQVGCGYACAFCLTGTMGLTRNLTAAEILGQLLHATKLLGAPATLDRAPVDRASGDEASNERESRDRALVQGHASQVGGVGGPVDALHVQMSWQPRITHLVFMGMGEPLANYTALVQAIRIMTDAKYGLGFSPRRITVSTVGLVSGIEKLGREGLGVNLAISLHAASDEIRSRLMPVNRAWNVDALMDAVRRYPLASRQSVFFEYVMLDGVNDSTEEARRLARLLRGVRAKVNLIPYNDWPGSDFRRPPLARILAFQTVLLDAGITTTVRWSKGEDIGAACGQLKETAVA